MRASSIYPGGPSRASGDPLTDRAEVEAARRVLGKLSSFEAAGCLALLLVDVFTGPEQFETQEDYMAARDAEVWGTADPFGEG